MARPPKDIDPEIVRKLVKIGCTPGDIAEMFGCSQSVISVRFRSEFALGRAQSKISPRQAQWRSAMRGSDRMLIHLGKVYLGQNDKVEVMTSEKPCVYIERSAKYIEGPHDPRAAELNREISPDVEAAIRAMGHEGRKEYELCNGRLTLALRAESLDGES
jgi:hypothetical protein